MKEDVIVEGYVFRLCKVLLDSLGGKYWVGILGYL